MKKQKLRAQEFEKEYKKKKIAEDTKNDLYEILKTDKKVTSEDFIKVYNGKIQ